MNANTNANDLNLIIQSLTSIIMSNNNLDLPKQSNKDNTLFKLIANDKINDLNIVIKNNSHNLNIQDDDGDTPLHIAVFLCNYKACELLILNNALINIEDNWGQLSIHRICFCIGDKNALKIINLFDKYQKKINNKNIFNSIDSFGNTTFHLVLKYLIKNNIKINISHIRIINKLKLLTNNKIKNKDNKNIHDLLAILQI